MSKILIDDDAAFRGSLAETVEDHEHTALCAASGEASLPLLAEAALVFLDLHASGVAADFRHLRETPMLKP